MTAMSMIRSSLAPLAAATVAALLLVVPPGLPAAAQEQHEVPEARLPTGPRLSLAEAMAVARDQAREVAAAEARLRASLERVEEARAHRLPVVRLQEILMRTDSPAEAFALTLNQERFSFQDFVAGDPNDPEAVENALTRLELEVPLYTGGELSSRIRQAELAAEAAGLTTDRTSDDAALDAAQAYLMLSQVREQVELLQRSLETVQAHVRLAQSYVEQGMLVRSELLRAQVERSRVEDLLEQARGQVRVAEAALAFRLAADTVREWDLAPVPPPPDGDAVAPGLPRDLEDWLALAGERPDLEAARRMARTAELEVAVKRAARLPRVGLVVRGDLVDDVPFGTHGESTTIIAQGSIDLFAGGRHKAAVAAARADAEAAGHDVRQFAEGIRLEVREAWVEARSAQRRHATTAAALDAAREAERITGERFRAGVVKTIDLLDAVTARREAETRELVARADANLAALRLATAAGIAPEAALPATAGTGPGIAPGDGTPADGRSAP